MTGPTIDLFVNRSAVSSTVLSSTVLCDRSEKHQHSGHQNGDEWYAVPGAAVT